MLQRVAFSKIQRHGGAAAPLFLALGLLLLIGLPVFKARSTYIDENAIGHMSPHVTVLAATYNVIDTTVNNSIRLLRGTRSPGSEVVAVYVNTAYAASIALANVLIESMRTDNRLSSDVLFFFVDESKHWPLPQSYTRAALVINISSLDTLDLCYDFYGKNGIQPNQDLVNSAVESGELDGANIGYLCRKNIAPGSDIHPVRHFLYSLENAVQISQQAMRWHEIPTHGISTLCISSYEGSIPPKGGNRHVRDLALILKKEIVALNGLEERFHHSTYVWISVDTSRYVEFDVAQGCIALFVATLLSSAYSIYQGRGVKVSPFIALLWFTPLLAHASFATGGPFLFIATSLLLPVFFATAMPGHSGSVAWATINALFLCTLLVLSPATGLLAGAGVAIQFLSLHHFFWHPVMLSLTMFMAWAVFFYFIVHLEMPLMSINGAAETFISGFIYPNAIWISSRLLVCIARGDVPA